MAANVAGVLSGWRARNVGSVVAVLAVTVAVLALVAVLAARVLVAVLLEFGVSSP